MSPSTQVRRSNAGHTPKSSLTWIGQGRQIKFGEFNLHGPLIYLADSAAGPYDEPAAVDVRLLVSPERHVPTCRELGYWPSYDGLAPRQRRVYLEWLTSGRVRVPAELGYTFLFIYGLERRALSERIDQQLVFDEVVRLRSLYAQSGQPPSRSFDGYTGSLLWFLVVRDPQTFALDRVAPLMRSTRFWTEDNLASALGWFAANSMPLPDWAAFTLARELPQSQRSVVASRVGDELRKLFCRRYSERLATGLQLRSSKRERKYSYRPASAALATFECAGPNTMGLPSQFQPVSDLWNACVQELKKLSSIVAKEGDATLTVAAWDAMPADLKTGVDHPLTNSFCDFIAQCADPEGHTIVRASDAAAALGFADATKLTLTKSRKICETAGHIGYCLEPDARLMGKGYKFDEPLAVFLRATDDIADPIRYGAASCMLRFGLAAASADGEVHPEETSVLMQQIRQVFAPNDEELRRLEALRHLILTKENDPAQIGRLAKELSEAQRQAVGKLLIALVAADGVVTDAELRSLRWCYAKLGMGKQETDAAIASLSETSDDEPVTVQTGQAPIVGGEAIPAAPSGLKLDRAAIAAILKDTHEVAEMLAKAMAVEAEPVPGPVEQVITPLPDVSVAVAGPVVMTTSDPTLPSRYAAFYQILISKGEWPLSEAQALARQHGHMFGGAVEALNDWAFEKFGGQLFVEDGERLVIEKAYLS